MFRILLVKDGDGAPDLEEKLRSKGFRVDVAKSLKDARKTEPDLVLIYTTPQRVGDWGPGNMGIPLMYLIDFEEEGNLVLTCPYGCIEKPVDDDDLKSCIDFVLKRIILEEERYRKLFEYIDSCVAVYEAVDDGGDFVIRDFNRAAERVEGVKREDILGRRVTDVFPGVDDFGLLEVLRRVYRTGRAEHFPLGFYTDERISGWRENFVYRLPSGEVVAVYRDLTERKKLEDELKEKERLYRSIFENTGSATTIVDEDTTILMVNREFERLSGYSREEIEGKKSWREFLADEDLKRMEGYHNLWMKDPELVPRSYNFRFRDRHGNVRYIRMTADPIPGTTMIVASLVDVTDIREAEEEILRSLREKEVLLREIHHRVKNNLQIISSLLNLQLSRLGDEEIRKMVRESQGRIKAMAMIHEHLYRSESMERVNFREYVEKLVGDIIISHGGSVRKNLEIEDMELDLDTAIPLGLIINELVTNSIKYAFPDGRGTITIGMRKADGSIELVVADDGVGLPEDTDPSSTDTLGLKLVSLLTKQLNGKMTLDVDGGTKFSIVFRNVDK
ncbi:PAS domain S-box protein [Methanothermobacter sp. K4]|uniref:PAS domain S-box protein n=1 Tax=Methanothermobacter sp. K4 TaxID=2913262 RepID=UPI001EDB682A|nr:PAS domain S-box protein [Methanothermobacter sp. K4]MCG2828465.1 PAS domain S-box protein [Methanothermobacter sp. K4]